MRTCLAENADSAAEQRTGRSETKTPATLSFALNSSQQDKKKRGELSFRRVSRCEPGRPTERVRPVQRLTRETSREKRRANGSNHLTVAFFQPVHLKPVLGWQLASFLPLPPPRPLVERVRWANGNRQHGPQFSWTRREKSNTIRRRGVGAGAVDTRPSRLFFSRRLNRLVRSFARENENKNYRRQGQKKKNSNRRRPATVRQLAFQRAPRAVSREKLINQISSCRSVHSIKLSVWDEKKMRGL